RGRADGEGADRALPAAGADRPRAARRGREGPGGGGAREPAGALQPGPRGAAGAGGAGRAGGGVDKRGAGAGAAAGGGVEAVDGSFYTQQSAWGKEVAMDPPPIAVALMLCRYVHFEEGESHNVSLIGCFSKLGVESFPATPPF